MELFPLNVCTAIQAFSCHRVLVLLVPVPWMDASCAHRIPFARFAMKDTIFWAEVWAARLVTRLCLSANLAQAHLFVKIAVMAIFWKEILAIFVLTCWQDVPIARFHQSAWAATKDFSWTQQLSFAKDVLKCRAVSCAETVKIVRYARWVISSRVALALTVTQQCWDV